MSGFTRAQMEAIAAREKHCCAKCGAPTWHEVARESSVYGLIHDRHAAPPHKLDLASGVLLCQAHAWWARADITEAAVLGYWLLAGDDPTHVPILIFGRGRVLLTSDGRYVSQEVPF